MKNPDSNLIIIFAFVILIVAIKRYFQWKRHQLWHETARIALEKGQPVPPAEPMACGRRDAWRWGGAWSPWFDLQRGLVLLAVGAALYLALPDHAKPYAAIPAFIGVANLLFGLFSFMKSGKPSDPRDQPPSNRA